MSLEQVLEKVVACLQHEQIHFGIGGSLLLHHHGLLSLRATSISSSR
ncbi:hypothetical protein [Exiguobacterium sp. KKBO11]|nr:hypothetical protein [Exiguobacterium sp. KKBO11]